MDVRSTRIMWALLLMASAAGANAQCIPGVSATNARSSCTREFSPQSAYANRKLRLFNDIGQALGSGGLSHAPARDFQSPVARSMSELPWAESRDWIHNPPEWLRELKDDHHRGAPLPLLHLWQSQQSQTQLSLGVNHRGQPGLFISRKLPF
jgi:hypothetical protein